ncbi:MAG: hypothetical protein LBN06_02505 [Prevotellaceae bacterium]|jgi:hypothetical protein|nr:hypothetical protein [Prevotellaceae bacterium]
MRRGVGLQGQSYAIPTMQTGGREPDKPKPSGNRKRIERFLDDALYNHYTEDDWTPDWTKHIDDE